jgi:16S rRNA (cytidine1402-2'-O)-methyltransferase
MKEGVLYLVPTQIADDRSDTICESVKEAIRKTDYFLVENIRTSRRYISSLRLGLVIEQLSFHVLDKNTRGLEIENLMEPIKSGRNVAILSESGCPGVADPGAKAVEWAQKNDIVVIPLVGPSSILLGLMGSGFNGQKFCFHGYLPIDKKILESELKRLEFESNKLNQTQIFIETPFRNNQMFKMLTQVNQRDTMLCIAKNLTAPDQMIETKSIEQWKKVDIDLHKIPTVFLLYAGS